MNFHLPNFIADEFPLQLWSPFKTLIAVSGGADSIALLRGMLEMTGNNAPQNIAVLHVNHGIRNVESKADAEFVQNLANGYGLEFHLVEIGANATDDDSPCLTGDAGRSEESLRNRRYQAFVETAKKTGARYLVTGHHLNDQVETVLFRVFRGTGINGLKGIPKFRVVDDALTIVRPMLKVSREQIVEYLTSIGQDFRRDSSNLSSDYTRNFLRNDILPMLNQRFGNVARAVSRLADQALEIDEWIETESISLRDLILQQTATEVLVDRSRLADVARPLIQRMLLNIWQQQNWPLQSMDAQWWQRLTQACRNPVETQPAQKLNLPGRVSAEFSRATLRFSRPEKTNEANEH